MTSPEVKKLLTENTERAVEEGAFGLPYFIGVSLFLISVGLKRKGLTLCGSDVSKGEHRVLLGL